MPTEVIIAKSAYDTQSRLRIYKEALRLNGEKKKPRPDGMHMIFQFNVQQNADILLNYALSLARKDW